MKQSRSSKYTSSARAAYAQKSKGPSGPARRHSNPVNLPPREPRVELPRNQRVVTGFHALREALAVRPKAIEKAWFKQGWESSADLKDLHQAMVAKGIVIEEKSSNLLDKVISSNQGAAAFLSKGPELDWNLLAEAKNSTVLVLDGLEDPHNLGAILRTSWLIGVDAVLAPEDRSASLTATVHKVACGGAEHVPVERVVSFHNPIEELKKNGFWVFGLSHEGTQSIYDLKIPEKVVWCIGSEDKGLRTTTEKLCDELVFLPQASAAASYNASVATAMALAETRRQRSHQKD